MFYILVCNLLIFLTAHASFISVNQLMPLPGLLESALTTHHGMYEPYSIQPSPYRWAFRLFLRPLHPHCCYKPSHSEHFIHICRHVFIRLFLSEVTLRWRCCKVTFLCFSWSVFCVFFPCSLGGWGLTVRLCCVQTLTFLRVWLCSLQIP